MTKLKDAPVIVGEFGRRYSRPHRLGHGATIARAAAKVRADFPGAPMDGGQLRKLAGDIWAMDDPVSVHTDGTAKGHRVIGVILVNDPGLMLFTENMVFDIPVGTIFHIDGHRRHGALACNSYQPGKLFAFLAWDVPSNSDLDELVGEMIPSLDAYANGEERINILAP